MNKLLLVVLIFVFVTVFEIYSLSVKDQTLLSLNSIFNGERQQKILNDLKDE